MTRWLALGLLWTCGLAVSGQTVPATLIRDAGPPPGYLITPANLLPNGLGGGAMLNQQFLVAVQPRAKQEPPPGTANPPAVRRFRSSTVPAGPVKLDQHGDPLPPGALARYGTTRLRHGPVTQGLGFSPDGKMLGSLSPAEDGIRLWDPRTGKELHRLNSPVALAAFCRDGTVLFVNESRCKVWIPEANNIRVLPEKTLPENVQVIAVHPDCRSFAAGTVHAVHQIDLQTGKLIRELKCPGEQPPIRLVFSADGRWLAGTGQKTGVWLWDLRSGKRLRTYHTDYDYPEFTFNSAGTRLAVATDHLRIYTTENEELIDNYKAPDIILLNPRFSPDGKFVLGIDPEGYVHEVNAVTGMARELSDLPEENVQAPMALSHDGTLAAAIGATGSILVWDTKTGKPTEIDHLPLLSDPVFSKDGKTIHVLAADAKIHSFDAASGKRLKVQELPVEEDAPVWWSLPQNRAVALGGTEMFELQIIDIESKSIVKKLPLPGGYVPTLSFCSRELSRGAVFGINEVLVIDFVGGKVIRNLSVGKPEAASLVQGDISPDGRLVAITTQPMSIWEVSTGKKRFDLETLQNAVGASFSQDGRYLAGWDAAGNIVVVDVRLGTVVRRFQAEYNSAVTPVVFSPDGKRLATADSSGALIVWDIGTGDTLFVFDRHDGYVSGLAFSPDGKRLVSTSQDGTALVWDVSSRQAKTTAENAVGGLDEAYRLLSSTDATVAQRGLEFLYRRPAETIKLLSEKIEVPAGVPAGKLKKLMGDLASDDFLERQTAVKELEALGGEALDALRDAAMKASDPEARKLAGEIVERLEASNPKAEDVRLIRAVELLEGFGTSEARDLLAKWARGPKGHRLTRESAEALARLKRAVE